MLKKLRTYFFTGLVVAAPIGITVYLTGLVIDSVDAFVADTLPPQYNPETYLPFSVPGIGLIIIAIFLILLGGLTANILGRTVLHLGESAVNRMPVIRSIYGTLKQIFETIASQSSDSFREVVLIEYPRKGVWALAFVTGRAKGPVGDKLGPREAPDEVISLFLPTTPNPTSGFLLFVPRRDVIAVDMTVEEGVKYVISAGIVIDKKGSS